MERYTSEVERTRWSTYAIPTIAPKTSARGNHGGPIEATSFRRGASRGTTLSCRSGDSAGIKSRIGGFVRSFIQREFSASYLFLYVFGDRYERLTYPRLR